MLDYDVKTVRLLTLGQAAKLVNKSKTALTRAIKAQRLKAKHHPDGSYSIELPELIRVYKIEDPTIKKQVQISLKEEYQTAGGYKVTLYTDKGYGAYPFIGAYDIGGGLLPQKWNINGEPYGKYDDLRLVARKKPFSIPFYVNIYKRGDLLVPGLGHMSQEAADAVSKEEGVHGGKKVTCVKVMLEGEI